MLRVGLPFLVQLFSNLALFDQTPDMQLLILELTMSTLVVMGGLFSWL